MKYIAKAFKFILLGIIGYFAAVMRGFLNAIARGDHVSPQADDDIHRYNYEMKKSHWNSRG